MVNSIAQKITELKSKAIASGSAPGTNNNNSILTKLSMTVYNIIMCAIVVICIITYIIQLINIIKFLYQCFLEVGNSQHNNLPTGSTLRYKLLGYVVFINSCNLPSLFSSFNSSSTNSSMFIRLVDILKNYFTNYNPEGDTEKDKFETVFGDLEKQLTKRKSAEERGEENYEKWEKNEGKDATADEKTKKRDELIREEEEKDAIEDKEKNSIKLNKEPKLNIFLVMRLIFICVKLVITLITIVVTVFITFILLSIMTTMGNMDTVDIQILMNQEIFSLLAKLLVISIIYIFVTLILYKTMFVKIYNKYLTTYLNIIAIDLKLNQLKNSGSDNKIEKAYVNLLRHSIENDAQIENYLIKDVINNTGITNNEIRKKYILFYILLKHLYSFNKDKNAYATYCNYFIQDENGVLSSEINVEKNNIKTFYSLIPNKHRKTPIPYFKYQNINEINDIELAETIRREVNNELTVINKYITNANDIFDDDNFIVDFGWYLLTNIIVGSIYFSIITVVTLGDTKDKEISSMFEFKTN